jgi:predicted NBD/HSP70 family sugar kinase
LARRYRVPIVDVDDLVLALAGERAPRAQRGQQVVALDDDRGIGLQVVADHRIQRRPQCLGAICNSRTRDTGRLPASGWVSQ